MTGSLITDSRLVEALRHVRPHAHLGLIYETQAERLEAAVAFLRIGLERVERCLCVMDEATTSSVRGALRAGGLDVQAGVQSGALITVGTQAVYFRPGHFDPDDVLNYWKEAAEAARSAGFSALCIVSDVTWPLDDAHEARRFMEYEARIDQLLHEQPLVALCLYDRKRFPSPVLLDVIRTHPQVIYDGRVCQNPYCVPPEQFLQPNQTARELELLLSNILAREQTEAALRESEARFRRLAENAPDIIFRYRLSPPRGFEYISPTVSAITGYTPEEFYADPDLGYKLIHPDDRPLAATAARGDLPAEQPLTLRRVHKDGSLIWTEQRNLLIRGPAGDVVAIEGILRDISRRKLAEEEIARRHRELSVLYSISHATAQLLGLDQTLNNAIDAVLATLEIEVGAIFLLEPDGKTLRLTVHRSLSEEFAQAAQRVRLGEGMTGRAAADKQQVVLDLPDYPASQFSPHVMREGFQTMVSTPLWSGGEVVGVLNLATRHPRAFPEEELELLATIGQVLGNSVQNARLYEAAQRELADRQQAEATLRESEERYRQLVELSPVAVFVHSDGALLFANAMGARMLGAARPEELIGRSLLEFIHADYRDAVAVRRKQIQQAGNPRQQEETQVVMPDGRRLYAEVSSAPITYEGQAARIAIVRDITRRKQAEIALREREEYLASLVNTVGDAILTVKFPERQIEHANQAIHALFGYRPEEVIGHTTRMFYLDDAGYANYGEKLQDALARGQRQVRAELELRRRNGEPLWAEAHTTFLDHDSQPSRVISVLRDVTERKHAEMERLRYAAQLQGLADASRVINSTLVFDDLLKIITEKAREIIGAHQSTASLTTDENWAQAIQHVSLSDKYAAWRDYDVKPDGSGIYRLVCQTNRSMRMTQAELEAHPAWRGFGQEASKHPPLRGWLAAPLVGRDRRNLGLIQLSDKCEGEFTKDDEAILTQLAQMASIAIENARLFEQVRSGREQLTALSKRLLEVQEAERRHVVRELHDEVGQSLTSLQLMLNTTARLPPDAILGQVREAQGLVSELIDQVHNLSLELRPVVLDDLGLLHALLWHIDRYTAQTSVQVMFGHRGLDRRFPSDVETAAYRIVQGALTNVARHASVGHATVQAWADKNKLGIRVADAGAGFDAAAALAAHASSGLYGMRERAALLGGELTVTSAPGQGTEVVAELPLSGSFERRTQRRRRK